MLLLDNLLTFHFQHFKKFNQHHLYTEFEKISSFSCFVFGHTRLQFVTLTTREGVIISHISGQEDFCIFIGSINQGLKTPPLSCCAQPCRYWWKMWFMFPRVIFQGLGGWGCLVGWWSYSWRLV